MERGTSGENAENRFVDATSASPMAHDGSASSSSKDAQSRSTHARLAHGQQEARDAQLRAELARAREANAAIEGVIASLNKARTNMETVNSTVHNASTLLATWTRILSQTEHNQRLILNPTWHGASQDVEQMQHEELRRQQEAERKAMEELRRREEAQRRAEEEERRRLASANAAAQTRGVNRTRSLRGATRGTARGYVGVGGQGSRGRGTSDARGAGGATRASSLRSRGRGLG